MTNLVVTETFLSRQKKRLSEDGIEKLGLGLEIHPITTPINGWIDPDGFLILNKIGIYFAEFIRPPPEKLSRKTFYPKLLKGTNLDSLSRLSILI